MQLKAEKENIRLDQYLFEIFREKFKSRTLIAKYIKKGIITVNNKVIKPSYKIKIEDNIFIPDTLPIEENRIKPVEIQLDIVYEDNDILIINKKAGQVVHPGIKHSNDTIVNGLIKKYKNLPIIGGRERPGIIHRLDKDTSGLLIIALNNDAYYSLIEMQKKHLIEKYYWGVVYGYLKEKEARIEIPIGRSYKDRKLFTPHGINSKKAITEYEVLDEKCNFSLIEFKLITGRTHQIRVHMKAIHHPIVGDIQYDKKGREIFVCDKKILLDCHVLMAKKLIFNHPITHKEINIEIPFDIKPFDALFEKK